jgi:phenylpropionate dioxygenase-like ring-hydroxylating dioxygenase large terminal subunit
MRLSHRMLDTPRRNWSARHYARILPRFDHLPAEMNRRWSYFGLFPNVFLDVFPDYMDTFQVIPVGPGKARLRSQAYALPDKSRAARAARYLSLRINTRVQHEDNALTASVQRGLASSGYQYGVLSAKEVVLKGFQNWLRARIPAARLAEAPRPGTLAAINATLAADHTTSR